MRGRRRAGAALLTGADDDAADARSGTLSVSEAASDASSASRSSPPVRPQAAVRPQATGRFLLPRLVHKSERPRAAR